MYIEDWDASEEHGYSVVRPSLSAIIHAVRSLNQKNKTLVMLQHDDNSLMYIGGGDGQYVITCELEKCSYVLTEGDSLGQISLVASGQAGIYAKNMVLSLGIAMEEIHRYANTQRFELRENWVAS